jgi:aspartate racemase
MAPVLGILGGMGPLATACFYRCLVERWPARNDQEHLPVMMWADPRVPDRTAALLGHGPSPLPAMLTGVGVLTRLGATCIAIPCNTAHAYLADLERTTGARFLDMPLAAMRDARERSSTGTLVGVLSTQGTRMTGIYERAARRMGLRACHVSDETQRNIVDPAIRGVKAGRGAHDFGDALAEASFELARLGAEVIVLGCTELPLIMPDLTQPLTVIDATASLADEAVRQLRPRVST